MSRPLSLTAAQIKKLLAKAPAEHLAGRKVALPELYEADIETAIVGAMMLDGWRAFKMQHSWDQVKKLELGEPGMPDHLFVRYWNQGDPRGPVPGYQTRCYNPQAELIWWEFKASKRRRKRKEFLSRDQTLWIQAERARGALIWVAAIDHEATIDGAAQHYLDSGLARRREPFVALIPPEARALPDRPRRLGDGE